MSHPAIFYDVALSLVPGVGCLSSKQLISYCGSAENVFTTPKGKLLKVPGVGSKIVDIINNKEHFEAAEKQLLLAEQYKVKIYSYTNPEFPERLKNIFDAPSVIYYKGNVNLNSAKMIAVVGTRNATTYGTTVTENIVEIIAAQHPDAIIVSGLAYGIDIITHRACVAHHLQTVGVMGNGMDKIYPAVHKDLAYKMMENGGVLTEYSFGTKADAFHFPARNRIVAGMTDATIVVEAAAKGGALITAELANSYDREVFAVPGNLNAKYSEGCNLLIGQNKARIFTSVEQLEKELNWDKVGAVKRKVTNTLDLSVFPMQQQQILKGLMEYGEIQMDELSWKINIPINNLASQLLALEFEGYIKALPGKRFKLSH